MSGTQRRSFRLEGYHRALLTPPDLAAARAQAQAPLNVTQLGLPQ